MTRSINLLLLFSVLFFFLYFKIIFKTTIMCVVLNVISRKLKKYDYSIVIKNYFAALRIRIRERLNDM
jgi:hypothetical protein